MHASYRESKEKEAPKSLVFFPCKSLFSCACEARCSRWFRRPNTLESSQKLWVVMRFTEATNLVIKPFLLFPFQDSGFFATL